MSDESEHQYLTRKESIAILKCVSRIASARKLSITDIYKDVVTGYLNTRNSISGIEHYITQTDVSGSIYVSGPKRTYDE